MGGDGGEEGDTTTGSEPNNDDANNANNGGRHLPFQEAVGDGLERFGRGFERFGHKLDEHVVKKIVPPALRRKIVASDDEGEQQRDDGGGGGTIDARGGNGVGEEVETKQQATGKKFRMDPDATLRRMEVVASEKLRGVSVRDYYNVAVRRSVYNTCTFTCCVRFHSYFLLVRHPTKTVVGRQNLRPLPNVPGQGQRRRFRLADVRHNGRRRGVRRGVVRGDLRRDARRELLLHEADRRPDPRGGQAHADAPLGRRGGREGRQVRRHDQDGDEGYVLRRNVTTFCC